ncbi:PAS domain S-box protein [Shimia sp. R11_0]|uniref:PAS domain-containing protein n=1 Tax=Shimia sp. R11_0 TaxID=2821096 RepID=UPI001ADA78E8|nr:PAS domain-containing protein [Shimia sp. R11_0]MBO9476815.1 PAS domain S-box protein [Shimia sp. R11_0]
MGQKAILDVDAATVVELQKVQMQALEKATGAGYWCLNVRSGDLWWSDKTKQIHGVNSNFRPDLEAALNFYVQEHRTAVGAAVETAMSEGAGWSHEFQILTADNERIWVHAVGEPVFSESEVIALAGSFRDISQSKTTDDTSQKLQAQKDEAVFELTHVTNALSEAAIVTTAGLDGKITSVNQKLLDISGYREEELIGANHNILNSGQHSREFFGDLWSTICEGKVWRGEICNRRKNGRLYWVDTLIYPVLNDEGKVEKFLSIRFDVTERVEASKLVSNFFEMSMAPHCIFDRKGRIQQANDACCALVQGREADLVGKSIQDFVVEEDMPNLGAFWQPRDEAHMGRTVRLRLSDAQGNVRHTDWQARVFGSLVFASGHDITAEIERRDALAAAKRTAEEASLSKSTFLANISHEIRTPLNAIVGVADALRDREDLSEEYRGLVQMIFESGRLLERQMSDILDFSKVEAGKVELLCQPFSPALMLQRALAPHVQTAQQKGVAFDIEVAPAAEDLVMGDDMRVRQIVSNLASNAVKFTSNGHIKTCLSCVCNGDVVALNIEVCDTGVGFPEYTKTDKFDRFDQKGGSGQGEVTGTGLGLAISSSLARQMGGRLSVESHPGAGSTFVVELALRKAPVPHTSAQKSPAHAGFEGCLQGRRVLIAEDIKANQKVVALLLKRTGCEIAFAGNGVEALQSYRSWRPDVVLMDMMMPEMNGLEATREIRILEERKALRHVPVIMLSANAMRDHVKQARDAGCDTHISKPVNKKALITTILSALDAEMVAAE